MNSWRSGRALNAGAATRKPDERMTRLLPAAFVLTLALLLLSCKANTSSAGEPATETTVPVPQATAAVVASPTTPPEPTATPEPEGIEVIGDAAFVAWTQQALGLIETRAPEAYGEVLSSIRVIESVTAGSGINVEEKRFAVGDETAHAPGYDEAQQMVWFAGTIVHDAHHSALFGRGEAYTGKDAEISCLTVQEAALQLLTDDPFFANYAQGLIDGADNPANQYWNQPNRHW
jgi:hypothetical protein